MNCLYVPNSDCEKTRTSSTGVKNVIANAAIRPDMSLNAGLNVEPSDGMDALRFRIVYPFCSSNETHKDVRPPRIDETAGYAAQNQAPHGQFQRHRVRS